MNRAMILESRRAIEQSERMKKLTLAATYFIPLTFTASLFGMNFGVLGQGDLPVWWYIVLAVPFTVLTHVLCSWDVQTLQSRYKRLLQTVKSR
jgi:Mg2+ and Co2+ transporter CorA